MENVVNISSSVVALRLLRFLFMLAVNPNQVNFIFYELYELAP